jgi:hypothetical protein
MRIEPQAIGNCSNRSAANDCIHVVVSDAQRLRALLNVNVMGATGTVPLKDHFDAILAQRDRYELAIRMLEQRHADREASWIKEKFDIHNNLLRAWQVASNEDRAQFVKTATFEALRDAFGVNTVTTAKALTLAEGKSKGYGAVTQAVAFVCGVVVALAAAWAVLRPR